MRSLTTAEVADWVGVTPATIRRYVRAGILPLRWRIAHGQWLFDDEDIRLFVRHAERSA